MTTAKRCLFCESGPPTIVERKTMLWVSETKSWSPDEFYYVECGSCGARGPTIYADGESTQLQLEKEAVDRWNTYNTKPSNLIKRHMELRMALLEIEDNAKLTIQETKELASYTLEEDERYAAEV